MFELRNVLKHPVFLCLVCANAFSIGLVWAAPIDPFEELVTLKDVEEGR